MSTDVFADDELDMAFDSTGFSADDGVPSTGGGSCNEEGFYHVTCNDITKEVKDGSTPCLRLDLQILAGTVDSQRDKMIFHRVYLKKAVRDKDKKFIGLEELSEGGMRMLLRCAVGFGLITKDQIGSPNLVIPWSRITGRQAIVEVRKEQDKDQNGNPRVNFKVPFGNIWPLGHEDVVKVPTDPEALALITGGAGLGGTSDIDDL